MSQGQTGHYFLSHYSPGDKRFDHASFDMAQDHSGVLHFATRSGILTYDGKNWELISCDGAVYAVEIGQSGKIFWAGANGFGAVVKDRYGRSTCEVRSDPAIKDIYRAVAIQEQVYFMNDNAVFVYEEGKQEVVIPADSLAGSFSSLFEIRGTIYTTSVSGDIFRLNGLNFERAEEFDTGLDVIFSSGIDNDFVLGTSDNRLFRYLPTGDLKEIKLRERDYLEASVIIDGAWVNQGLIALATLRGGVIFLDPTSGSIEQIINYDNGLPDNEIFALLKDKNNNAWVSHEYGFTRISPFIPFRSYSHYDNLKGNLLCAISLDNEVYVGTSLGLFKLIREDVYEDLIYYVDVPVRRINTVEPIKNQKDVKEDTSSEAIQDSKLKTDDLGKKKRGFLRFLKRNRSKIETQSEEVEPSKEKQDTPSLTFKAQVPSEEFVIQRIKKTRRILRTAHFTYKKVSGMEAKVTDVAIINNTLVAGGLGGVFEILGLESKPILEEPIRVLVQGPNGSLIISTLSDKVLRLQNEDGEWTSRLLLDNLPDQISYVFNGRADELWLCATNKVYRLDSNTKNVLPVGFQDLNYTTTVGTARGDDILFLNADGHYRFDRAKNSILKLDSLRAPETFFASASDIWYLDDHSWKVLNQRKLKKEITKLNHCGEIRFIASDYNSDNLWIINGENELYKFFSNNLFPSGENFPLKIKSVSQGEVPIPVDRKIVVDQDGGPISIELIRANFIAGSQIEYRYFLKGINEDWSDWSTRNDRINFSYLPPGNYALSVQSKDGFGTINEIVPLQFHVRPLYWKTPWFYAMEFSVFALLVLLSFKLSVRYRIISRVLSLLTIILLIEFIQTVIGFTFFSNSGPVIDFVIQVFIALIILPVEGFLRNLMFKSMGANSRLFQIITELDRQQRNRK